MSFSGLSKAPVSLSSKVILQNTAACGIVFAIICLWLIYNYGRGSRRNRTPPEAAGALPVIGHLHLLGGNKVLHHILGAMADVYGPIFCVRLGIHKAVVISSWEVAKECFTTNDITFASRPKSLAVKIMGYDHIMPGFAPYGPYWRNMRKLIILELLSSRRLEILKHVRDSEVKYFIKELYDQCIRNGGENPASIEIKERFEGLAMKIIVRMISGEQYEDTSGGYGNEQFLQSREAFRNFMHLVGMYTFTDAIPCLGWIDALTGHTAKLRETAKDLDAVIGRMVEQHQQKRQIGGSIDMRDQDFIHVLLALADEAKLSGHDVNTVVKATCLSLVLGGSDTVPITLTWAISLLLNHPHVLRKAQEELDIQVGRSRQVEESDIENLSYLQAVAKETLRLRNAAPLSAPRQAINDCTIAGFHIAKGTRLVTNLWKLHRDPNIWSDPSEFQPERFLQQHVNMDVRGQDFEFLPFGSGRRICPGISFALQVLHLTLARMLHGFRIATVSDLPVDMTESCGLSVSKATPLEVILTPRLSENMY